MTIKIGDVNISKMYLGSTPVSKVYLGTNEIYSSGPPVVPIPTGWSKVGNPVITSDYKYTPTPGNYLIANLSIAAGEAWSIDVTILNPLNTTLMTCATNYWNGAKITSSINSLLGGIQFGYGQSATVYDDTTYQSFPLSSTVGVGVSSGYVLQYNTGGTSHDGGFEMGMSSNRLTGSISLTGYGCTYDLSKFYN